MFQHRTQKTRVCEVCGSAALHMEKSQGEGENYSQFKTFFFHCVNRCVGPKGYLETEWVETPAHTVYDLKNALEQALDDVAWLTKQNARLKAADAARVARLEESLKTDEERAAEATAEADAATAEAAASIYGSFGRDEWPTR